MSIGYQQPLVSKGNITLGKAKSAVKYQINGKKSINEQINGTEGKGEKEK